LISTELIIISTAIYLAMMFFIAFRVDKRDQGQFSRFRPLIYTLSLAVYCTSWTFYGAVGTAASSGWSFFTIYLGPIIVYTLFFPFIRKIIAIAKRHKTTSIADFLATRYGKSSLLAALVTLIAFVGTLPYIALQIKAISSSFDMLTAGAVSLPRGNFQNDTAFMLALILAAFSILFGARTVDASQHHKGLIYAIAFESVIKIVAFLAIAVMAYNLLDSLSQRDPEIFSTHRLLWLPFETLDFKPSMLTTLLLAAGAIFLLPRQFHVLAVEAKGGEDASRWGLPVYLLLFSVAVIPITSAGLMVIGSEHHADLYVLLVPMSQGNDLLSVFAYLGGFAAATGMVIVATLALSTMVSNDLIVPVLVRYYRNDARQQMHQQLLLVRRATILLILMLAYGFCVLVSRSQAWRDCRFAGWYGDLVLQHVSAISCRPVMDAGFLPGAAAGC
jgi:Na+/proline symporter